MSVIHDTIQNIDPTYFLHFQEFEKVLHPIFQEDELTLILVGTALGAAAGFAQVPFYL